MYQDNYHIHFHLHQHGHRHPEVCEGEGDVILYIIVMDQVYLLWKKVIEHSEIKNKKYIHVGLTWWICVRWPEYIFLYGLINIFLVLGHEWTQMLRRHRHKLTNWPIDHQCDRLNLPYVKYYHDLETYQSPTKCYVTLRNDFESQNRLKITSAAAADPLSRLGTYLMINPNLCKPEFINVFELERIRITRYRVGSNNLRIETGRMCNPVIPREERLCICGREVQPIVHNLTICPLLENIYEKYDLSTVDKAFEHPDIGSILLEIEKILKIPQSYNW